MKDFLRYKIEGETGIAEIAWEDEIRGMVPVWIRIRSYGPGNRELIQREALLPKEEVEKIVEEEIEDYEAIQKLLQLSEEQEMAMVDEMEAMFEDFWGLLPLCRPRGLRRALGLLPRRRMRYFKHKSSIELPEDYAEEFEGKEEDLFRFAECSSIPLEQILEVEPLEILRWILTFKDPCEAGKWWSFNYFDEPEDALKYQKIYGSADKFAKYFLPVFEEFGYVSRDMLNTLNYCFLKGYSPEEAFEAVLDVFGEKRRRSTTEGE